MKLENGTFLDENSFKINKLKRQKSKEILQYQHTNGDSFLKEEEEKTESMIDSFKNDLKGEERGTNNQHFLNIKNAYCSNQDKNVYLEPLKGKQKRPKFLLDFKILGLNNIPLFDETTTSKDKVGVCYVKWSLPDYSHDHLFKSKKTSKHNTVYLRDYEALKFFSSDKTMLHKTANPGHLPNKRLDFSKMDRDTIEDTAHKILPNTEYMHPSGTNPGMYKVIAHNDRKGATKRSKVIHNYCNMDYQLESPVIVKINIDEKLVKDQSSKRGDRNKITRNLRDEFMIVECYYELLQRKTKARNIKTKDYRKTVLGNIDSPGSTMSGNSSENDTISINTVDSTLLEDIESNVKENLNCNDKNGANHKVLTRIKLGDIKINLTEYVSEGEEWQTNYFLLQDSKVNSVLKFSCHLKLVRGSYNEFDLPNRYTSGQLPGTLPRLYQNRDDLTIKANHKANDSSSSFHHDNKNDNEHLTNHQTKNKRETDSDSFELQSLEPIKYPLESFSSTKKEPANELETAFENKYSKLLKLSLLTSLKHENFVNNYLRNPYEYDDPRDCVRDIIEGKSGWNIDAIFNTPANSSKKINQDTYEMSRLLDKYGSTKKLKASAKLPHYTHNSLSSRIKTTGGWYFKSSLKPQDFDGNYSDYQLNDVWEEFDDSDIDLEEKAILQSDTVF